MTCKEFSLLVIASIFLKPSGTGLSEFNICILVISLAPVLALLCILVYYSLVLLSFTLQDSRELLLAWNFSSHVHVADRRWIVGGYSACLRRRCGNCACCLYLFNWHFRFKLFDFVAMAILFHKAITSFYCLLLQTMSYVFYLGSLSHWFCWISEKKLPIYIHSLEHCCKLVPMGKLELQQVRRCAKRTPRNAASKGVRRCSVAWVRSLQGKGSIFECKTWKSPWHFWHFFFKTTRT